MGGVGGVGWSDRLTVSAEVDVGELVAGCKILVQAANNVGKGMFTWRLAIPRTVEAYPRLTSAVELEVEGRLDCYQDRGQWY